MNRALSDSQLEEMIKSAVNSSAPLPPDEKFSLLVSALRELQQYRAAAKPVCYALTNSEGEVYNTHSLPENAEAYRWLIHQSDDSLTLRVTPLYAAPQLTSAEREELEQYRAAAEPAAVVLSSRAGNDTSTIDKALPEGFKLYAAPQVTSVPDEHYRQLSDLYHAQEKRLFKLAQRIKGLAFDKYAYSPSQAIDVLESAIFGEREEDGSACRAAMLQRCE